jgi:hypothetical protein
MKKVTPKERLTVSPPPFFQKIIAIALSLAAIGGVIIGADSEYPGYLPDIVIKVSNWLIIGGIVATGISGLTVDHSKRK